MLRIYRSERADRLASELALILREPLQDAFTPDVVGVPTRGVERWLSQQLALCLGTTGTGQGRQGGFSGASTPADGICANVMFPYPWRLVGDAISQASGVGREDDPWGPSRSVWPLIEVVQASAGQAWLSMLEGHLVATGSFAAMRRIADLFDSYAVHHPSMIHAWAQGRDVGLYGEPLPADLVWQAELWRRLRERVGQPSIAERVPLACDRLRSDPALAPLPDRVSLFGVTRLPVSHAEVLRALAAHREVHLFLLHPSAVLWDLVGDSIGRERSGLAGPLRRSGDWTGELVHNRLLAAWGRDSREVQLVLGSQFDERVASADIEDRHLVADLAAPTTLLRRIQRDIHSNAPAPDAPTSDTDARWVLTRRDRSVQVHACHGRARQVEVLRDAILHELADDPTLEPRDIIVMCPDIDSFAPMIQATFGAGDQDHVESEDPSTRERMPSVTVRLADRSLSQTNPLLAALGDLLRLVDERFKASQLVDLASREPVRRRFRFNDDELARIEEWAASAGVRWGLDGDHRQPYKVSIDANTWKAGLDRLALGVAMSEDGLGLVGGVLPLDDVDSSDIDLTGRLAELVDRLVRSIDDLSGPRPISSWMTALDEVSRRLFATSDRDQWQRTQLEDLFEEVRIDACTAQEVEISLQDLRSVLDQRLGGRPTRANFRTGHLTMCTLVPMRSVPHRVVCLLGLDDGAFPRQSAPDGDDVARRDPCVGDLDHRSEDRQLLLDALLAAEDRLIITYSGHDERTNALLPPAVPLGELLDTIEATARAADDDGPAGQTALDMVVVHHPLQRYDERNFVPGDLGHPESWSFDSSALDGARAATGPRQAPGAFISEPLRRPPGEPGDPGDPGDPRDPGDPGDPGDPRGSGAEPSGTTPPQIIELDDLVSFVRHPVRAFLRQRLGLTLAGFDDDASDQMPVELNHLESWDVGQRLLQARLAGMDAETCWRAEMARGYLPPAELGLEVLDRVAPDVERIVEVVRDLVGDHQARSSKTVSVALPGGRVVAGTVTDVVDGRCTSVTFSRIGPSHRLAAWVRFLALCGSDGSGPIQSLAIGRGRRRRPMTSSIGPLSPHQAREQLARVADLYERGMREPLPIYCKTSAAFANSFGKGQPLSEARREWVSRGRSGGIEGEDRDLAHQLVLGGVMPFESLLLQRPRPGEDGPGWHPDADSRFGRYALRLWEGLLEHEELSDR